MRQILWRVFLFGCVIGIASNVIAQDTVFATATPQATTEKTIPAVATTPPSKAEISTSPSHPTYNPTVCNGMGVTGEYSEACLQMMADFPEPPAEDVPLDGFTLSYYNYWQIGPGATTKFDAPGGNVVGEIPAGYNFVNAINTDTPGWLQIEGGEWVSRDTARYTEASQHTGVTLPFGLDYPFLWILDTFGLFPSASPGGEQNPDSERFIRRYERLSIFDETQDEDGWIWYLVGPDQWIKQTFVAVAKVVERPEGVVGNWVGVDLFEQVLVAYEDDTPVFATLISSGVEEFSTNEGVFTIWSRLDRDAMSGATGAPDAYALQSVPWTMYFDGGISLHGTFWHDLFGYRHSHGCVNLSISDAKYVFDWTLTATPNENGEIQNFVYVYSTGEYRSSSS